MHLSKLIELQKDSCTPLFIVALYIGTKAWEQPNVHGQMNGWRRHGVYAIEYYSAITENENSICSNKVDLKIIMWSEVSQKKASNMLSLICGILKKRYKGAYL